MKEYPAESIAKQHLKLSQNIWNYLHAGRVEKSRLSDSQSAFKNPRNIGLMLIALYSLDAGMYSYLSPFQQKTREFFINSMPKSVSPEILLSAHDLPRSGLNIAIKLGFSPSDEGKINIGEKQISIDDLNMWGLYVFGALSLSNLARLYDLPAKQVLRTIRRNWNSLHKQTPLEVRENYRGLLRITSRQIGKIRIFKENYYDIHLRENPKPRRTVKPPRHR